MHIYNAHLYCIILLHPGYSLENDFFLGIVICLTFLTSIHELIKVVVIRYIYFYFDAMM